MHYGAAFNEVTRIFCSVDGYPQDVSFFWTLNKNELADGFVNEGLTSALSFTPTSMRDYGILSCWAKNSVGTQKEPCILTVNAIGPPEPVSQCAVVNRTTSTVQIDCAAGFDGGLKQSFHLELFDASTSRLVTRLSAHENPAFFVRSLPPGTDFAAVVYSVNDKGKSSETRLAVQTTAAHITSLGWVQIFLTDENLIVVAAAAGGVVFIVVFSLVITLICAVRKRLKGLSKHDSAGHSPRHYLTSVHQQKNSSFSHNKIPRLEERSM